jgi:hypothetical protein
MEPSPSAHISQGPAGSAPDAAADPEAALGERLQDPAARRQIIGGLARALDRSTSLFKRRRPDGSYY